VTVQVVATGGTGTYNYTWVIQGPTITNTATGETPTLNLFETGQHDITVTASDSNGITGRDSITLYVIGPTQSQITDLFAVITSPILTTWGINTPVTFVGAGQQGTAPYTYLWTWAGPAETVPVWSTASTDSFTFPVAGTYVGTFTVKDSLGYEATATITVTIE